MSKATEVLKKLKEATKPDPEKLLKKIRKIGKGKTAMERGVYAMVFDDVDYAELEKALTGMFGEGKMKAKRLTFDAGGVDVVLTKAGGVVLSYM